MPKRYHRDPALGKSPYVNIVRPSDSADDVRKPAEHEGILISNRVFPRTVPPDAYKSISGKWFGQAAMKHCTLNYNGVVGC